MSPREVGFGSFFESALELCIIAELFFVVAHEIVL